MFSVVSVDGQARCLRGREDQGGLSTEEFRRHLAGQGSEGSVLKRSIDGFEQDAHADRAPGFHGAADGGKGWLVKGRGRNCFSVQKSGGAPAATEREAPSSRRRGSRRRALLRPSA